MKQENVIKKNSEKIWYILDITYKLNCEKKSQNCET